MEFAPLAGISKDGLSIIWRGGRAPPFAIVVSMARTPRMKADELLRHAQRQAAKNPRPRVYWWHEHKES